ncbi:MAG: SulP family inorganic anion transporter, partial [Thermoplasmata archaeon]|nr:SulP family inorganic anion transporter [Thermoplasmata archaeon]
DPTLIPGLFPAAIAIAIVALVESAGISAAFPNPDKSKTHLSKDFTATGLGNLVGSFIAALPGGGSMSRTAINQDAGSMTRFGGVFAGAVVILAIAVFGPVFEFIPMAALSGLLIFIGAEILLKQVPKIKEGWYTSRSYSISMFATFIISIVYSLEVGVFTGIILSMVLYVYFSSKEIQLIALEPLEGKQFRIRSPPKEFPSGEVTIIQQQGTRYYAAITVMEEMMPSWDNTNDAVIIFSIYGRSLMSSNMVDLVESMHKEMTEGGNHLILANVEGPIMEQMERTGLLDLLGRENVFPAEEIVGASIWKALESANETLGRDEKE